MNTLAPWLALAILVAFIVSQIIAYRQTGDADRFSMRS